ncbi:MAG: formate dehydrogenase accessory protein FdhE [Acidobacteria bacterium]|nr:formate dehydrogenase accessory protein FdhE [Acidobacteriota bacterium]
MSKPPLRTRPESREVAELRALAERQPELSPAAHMQIDLVDAQRRAQSRLTTPWIDLRDEVIGERLARGERLADFEQLTIDWTEARLLVRQITDIFRRYDAIEGSDVAALHDVGRGSHFPMLARLWYDEPLRAIQPGRLVPAADPTVPPAGATPEMLGEVLRWALRPFLARTAEVFQQRAGLEQWQRGYCAVCAGQPELAVITSDGSRHLICGRCQARWLFPTVACPFCNETSRDQLVSFATPDGTYRVTACRTCQRYLKALDGRHVNRPALPALDSIATLPLDALVLQKGFNNG